MSLRIEVWVFVELGYAPKATDTEKETKEDFVANAKAMNSILNGLCEANFIKVMHKDTAKEMWDTLENIHEGDKKVKTTKLQVYRAQFENLKMNDDEDIANFFLKVAEIINNMKALGEKMPESIIVQNILRSLPSRFNPKVSAIEETTDWDTLTMNQLLGNLTAYEMRLPQEIPSTRVEAFKAEKKKEENGDTCSSSDEEEAKFVKKLDRG